MPTLRDVAEFLGLWSERQMAAKLKVNAPISTLALIKAYEKLPPKARFSVFPGSGTMPLTVQFTDQSLGYITARTWKFDDGGTSTDRNPSHTYKTPEEVYGGSDGHLVECSGFYPTLTVSNKAGSDTASGSVNVAPAPPMPKFSADPTSGAAPLNVNFAVDRSAGYCLTHQWNFGDPASGDRNSATTSGQSGPVHVYKQAGSYHVVLNLSNSAGQTYADTTITVTGGSGSGGPPSGDTPYITAGLDPNPDYSGVDVSGSKFTPNTQVHINVTKKSDKSLLASGSVPADDLGTFSKQFINVPSCTGSGSTEFTIVVQATDYSGALSNPVEVSCYTTGSP